MKKLITIISFLLILANTDLISQSSYSHRAIFDLSGSYINSNQKFGLGTGLEYEYYFPISRPQIGVGLQTQALIHDQIELIALPTMFIHSGFGLNFLLAPGITYWDAGPLPDGEIDVDKYGSQLKMLMRIGVSYDIYIQEYLLYPKLTFDMIGNNYRLNLGVNFGINF